MFHSDYIQQKINSAPSTLTILQRFTAAPGLVWIQQDQMWPHSPVSKSEALCPKPWMCALCMSCMWFSLHAGLCSCPINTVCLHAWYRGWGWKLRRLRLSHIVQFDLVMLSIKLDRRLNSKQNRLSAKCLRSSEYECRTFTLSWNYM